MADGNTDERPGQRRTRGEPVRREVGRWQGEVLRQVTEAAGLFWQGRLREEGRGVHLAVMVEPYLSLLMEGRKTVESRFSATRRAPWGCVGVGDIVLVKRSSGPVVGVAEVGRVWGFEIGGVDEVAAIRREFGGRVCGGEAFWAGCAGARYGTLLEVARVGPVKHVNCHKRDQRGWVVLRPGLHRQ
jgi:hypothetical protein